MGVHANNRTAGFHVHVGVDHLSLDQLKKVCQSFIKYEAAFDMMVPRSRRDNEYCMSNRFSGRLGTLTNKQANDAIGQCHTMDELLQLMNPDNSKHYKLSLMPVASGRQATVEFRQHSATSNYNKVAAWVRLLVHFVKNTSQSQEPRALLPRRDQDHTFDMLFKHVIRDRFLRDFYSDRAQQLAGNSCDDCDDCGDCSGGSDVSFKRLSDPFKIVWFPVEPNMRS
eukprot:scaffold359142_cov37-Prasinocladus_malaysianus.AAC.1